MNSFIIFIFFIKCHLIVDAVELRIETTYQAEDNNLETEEHAQCKAWKLWERTRNEHIDLSPQDIDVLSSRRSVVQILNIRDAEAYDIPEDLLHQYKPIIVNFEEICRFHARILRITSRKVAVRYRVDTTRLCFSESNDTNILEEETNDDVSWLNDTIAMLEYQPDMDLNLLRLHQSIAIFRKSICTNSTLDEPLDIQYYKEKYGNFGFNVSVIGENVDKLIEKVRNTARLDEVFKLFEEMSLSEQRPFPATQLLPWLKHVKYDSRTPPVIFQGDQVVVKIGLHIQSMSNFELSTMDYNVDGWIRMAWLDPRLCHSFSRPVVINEYTFLKKIWRPDPIFKNSKAAAFHMVSNLNFYMFIFPDGLVFLDLRVHLKPTVGEIVLCKYPHDKPACSLKISALGFTQDAVRFEWFSDHHHAIRLNQDVQIPELVLMKYTAEYCDGHRKSGNYSCLEAKFYMQRQIGYHIAQTYIPTALCVLFSMISVWLPEEFVEGRIFVSLTVFLTLSAESNSAKEDLPKVSYIKAIDIWFGFTSSFVFLTMIQALTVITLEHWSRKLRKKCEKNVDEFSRYKIAMMMLNSHYYHKLGRNLDTFCKVMYPVFFLLFLMIYGFVITQGDEDKCIQNNL
ncbi:unnamed protein product [Auanema sp. JU1783]|nr:unnamed protein product [Auanema sp. JU1783]